MASCGDPPPQVALTLAQAYDASGVVRVFPDGLTPTSLEIFSLTLDSLRFSGGKANGQLQGEGGRAVAVTGTFDAEDGELQFDLVTAALTSTVSESVAIGGRGDDGLPRDGVADQLVGFVRAEIGVVVREGTFLGVSRYADRPAPVDIDKVSATDEGDGNVVVRGTAGAAIASVGVEIVRFNRDQRDPDFGVVRAEADGSFSLTAAGIASDVFLVRNAPAGRVGEARAVVAR